MPDPMSFVSLEVKNDLTLNGYFKVGSILMTTFKACDHVNTNADPQKAGSRTVIAVKTMLSWDCLPSRNRFNTLSGGEHSTIHEIEK